MMKMLDFHLSSTTTALQQYFPNAYFTDPVVILTSNSFLHLCNCAGNSKDIYNYFK
jgi:hypothetical protein